MSNLSRRKTPGRPFPLKHTSGPKELTEVTRKGWGIETQCLRKFKHWEIKESHKIDKLDMMTFKLIAQVLHTSGSQSHPKTNRSILVKNINCCDSLFQDTFSSFSVYAESFVLLSFKVKLCLCRVSACLWSPFLGFLDKSLDSHFSSFLQS